jgi:hypothetical protein
VIITVIVCVIVVLSIGTLLFYVHREQKWKIGMSDLLQRQSILRRVNAYVMTENPRYVSR